MKKGVNFLISIIHQENHSWQGSIEWLDTGNKLSFRSELELIMLIHDATKKNDGEEDLRVWQKNAKYKAL